MFVVLILTLFCVLYFLNLYAFGYWKRRNIPQAKGPKFLVGNALKMFTGRQFLGDMFKEIYDNYKHKRFVGVYLSYRPVIVINDPELIQDVMITNFSSFHDRQMPINEKADPLTGNLFFLKGQKWRDLRVKFSPTFTSGKLKRMFPIIRDCGLVLQNFIDKNIQNGKNILEFRDLTARFTTNIISSVAFGIDNDSINEPNNIFREMGMKIFDQNLITVMKNVIGMLSPNLFVKLNTTLFPAEVYKFFTSLVNQTIEYREKNNFHRNDFMDLLIELKNNGYVSVDKDDEDEAYLKQAFDSTKKLEIKEIIAQVFVFFAAGFETSSSTMQFCLYELCKNREIRNKVHEEIDRIMKKAGPEGITFDLLKELKYLECCIEETLRKYPIVPVHFREATKDFNIPGTDVVIEKGTGIHIPVMGIQRDPEIYEDPLLFKPERFLNSPIGNPKKTAGIIYSPFGDGPRNCIGSRMGKLQTKFGLFALLEKFDINFSNENMGKNELTFHPGMFTMTPLEKFYFKVSYRH